jgi:hypothetical protein
VCCRSGVSLWRRSAGGGSAALPLPGLPRTMCHCRGRPAAQLPSCPAARAQRPPPPPPPQTPTPSGGAPPEELRRADGVPAERDQAGAEDARLEVHAVHQPARGAVPHQVRRVVPQPHLLQQHHVLRGERSAGTGGWRSGCGKGTIDAQGHAEQRRGRQRHRPGTLTASLVESHSPRYLRAGGGVRQVQRWIVGDSLSQHSKAAALASRAPPASSRPARGPRC